MNIQSSTRSEMLSAWQSVTLPGDDTVARLRPYDATPRTTQGNAEKMGGTKSALRKVGIAPVEAARRPAPGVHSIPIQIWEGTVIDVDCKAGTIEAMLDAKLGSLPRHAATIAFDWIPAQDYPLVAPGAVFYLTLYRETERSSIRNAQEIRFRRLPSWSKAHLKRISNDAALFLGNIEA